jgi:FkbM family methyltransferase
MTTRRPLPGGEERDTVTFEYTPYWHADEHRRHPVSINLEMFEPDDLIAREIREARTFFEIELLEHLGIHGPLGGVYVDVGANIGNHSVFFGKFLAEHVVAVEPQPALVAILARNMEVNGIGHCSLVACAAGAEVGVGQLSLPEAAAKNIGHTRVMALTREARTVLPIIPLDQLIDGLAPHLGARRVTCVKIDVEGTELNVLQGAMGLLQNHRPQLVIELASEESRQSVRGLLGRLGYRDAAERFCWAPTYHFIDPQVHHLRASRHQATRDPAADRMRLMTEELCALVAPGDTFILVDQEEAWAGLVIDGRRRRPFLEKDGLYWGPPPDDTTASGELERLRKDGAGFIAFASNAFWWLDHYAGFVRYLKAHYRRVLSNERLVVFDLRSSCAPSRE